MRWRRAREIGSLVAVALCGCSAGPSNDAAHPRADVTPIPTVKTSAPPPRPSACEVAELLVARADALTGEGLIARARRALADAEARCPEKAKAIGEARARADAARAVASNESAQSLAEALAKMGSGDVAARRREKERWLVAAEREAGVETRLSMPVRSMPLAFAWSADGTLGAVLQSGEVSIYDSELRAESARYLVGESMLALRWFPSGKALIVGDLDKGQYRIVDLVNKKVGDPFDVPGAGAESFDVTADGKFLVVTAGLSLSLTDLEKRKPLGALVLPSAPAGFAASPAGDTLAVGLSDGGLRLYSLPALALLREMPSPAGSVPTFQSDKHLLVTGAGRVLTFEVATGKPVGKPLVNDDCTPMVAGKKNDRIVWSCYAMLEAETTSGSKRTSLYTPGTEAHLYTSFDSMSMSPDGELLWYSLWGQQYIVSTRTGHLESALTIPSWWGVRIRPGGKRVAAVRTDGTSLWTSDLAGKDERVVVGGDGPGTICSIVGIPSTGAPVFADIEAAGENGLPGMGTLTLRGAGTDGETTGALKIEHCPESMPEGAARIGISAGDQLNILGLPTGASAVSIPLASAEGEKAALSADGSACAVWGKSGLRVIDVATEKARARWPSSLGFKATALVSRTGKRVLVVQEGRAQLWEVGREAAADLALGAGPFAFAGDDLLIEAKETELWLHDLATHEDRSVPGVLGAKRIAVSPDGSLAIVMAKGMRHVIDLAKGAGILATAGSVASDDQIVFFAGGRVLGLHSSYENTLTLYQLPSGTRLGELRRTGKKGAVYAAETGNLEPLGDGASGLRCARDPAVLPFSDCSERLVETGLFARALAGRGCTSEDVGDVCD